MNFLFPRTITITRPTGETAIGAVGYGGATKAAETVVIAGIAASIQARSGSSRPHAGDLPAAAPGPVTWNVYLDEDAVANGVIHDRDIVTDDNGERYQIDANNWTPLGYKLITTRLEAH